jgi:hypothetical protein
MVSLKAKANNNLELKGKAEPKVALIELKNVKTSGGTSETSTKMHTDKCKIFLNIEMTIYS